MRLYQIYQQNYIYFPIETIKQLDITKIRHIYKNEAAFIDLFGQGVIFV